MPAATGMKVEVEFVKNSGTWVDVTNDVGPGGVSMKFGRTSAVSQVTAATCGYQLDNQKSDYTPGLQMEKDGVTPHPYYPNVLPRRRTRTSFLAAGVRQYRCCDYVKSWAPLPDQGDGLPRTTVAATCRLDQLAKTGDLMPAPLQSILQDAPFALWPNNDAAGSRYAADYYNGLKLVPTVGQSGSVAWGQGQAVQSSGAAEGLTAGRLIGQSFLSAQVPTRVIPAGATNWTVEWWGGLTGTNGTGATNQVGMQLYDNVGTAFLVNYIDRKDGGYNSGVLQYSDAGNALQTIGVQSTSLDSLMHHYAVVGIQGGTGGLVVALYIDGVFQAQINAARNNTGLNIANALTLFPQQAGFTNGVGNDFGTIAVYGNRVTAARIAMHAAMGLGSGQTTGARIAEYLSWAGFTGADVSVMPGVELVGVHPVVGKNITQMCQEMVETEGGGAVFYSAPTGVSTFYDRTFRKPGAPIMILDAEADLDGTDFAPIIDELNLVTRSTVSRNGGSAVTYVSTAAELMYGVSADSATSYAMTDLAALNLAQDRINGNSTPSLRFSSFTLDMLTAQTAGLDVALGQVAIGARIRIVNLQPGLTTTNQIDLIIEGWGENLGVSVHTVTFDVSAADNPRRGIWGTAKWQPNPNSIGILTAAAANAISVKVRIAAGSPGFTTAAGMYPLQIQLGAEVLTVTAAPAAPSAVSGSSDTQQTLTVTRGSNALPLTVGQNVTLYPRSTWTL